MNALHKWMLSLAGTSGAVALSYQWLDRPIALFFHQMVARPEPLAKITQLPHFLVPLAGTAILALGLCNLSGRALSRLQTCALLCGLSLVVADITKAQLKLVFGRTWPSTWMNTNPSFLRDGVYGFNFFHGGYGYASFPSGHMAMTCAVIAVLWVYYPSWRKLIGLIGANYHFLSDVIAGGFIGISSGWMIRSLWKSQEHFARS